MSDARPKDYLDREINIGDTVAYPTRLGSDMWLSEGIVTDFRYDPHNEWTLILRVDAMVKGHHAKRIAKGVPARRCLKIKGPGGLDAIH